MKFFVTGVGGQLGHDVMNELIRRGHEGVGSDIQEQYSGVEDGSEVTKAPYLSLLFLVQGISGMRIPSYGQESGMVDAGRLPNWYLHPHPSA